MPLGLLRFIQCIIFGVRAFEPLTKLQLSVSKSLLTKEIWLRVGLIQCTIALDAGWVACCEKLNRSLCSLKIKLFLDAGGGDWGLFDAQCTFCQLVRGIIKRREGRGER